MIVPPIVSIDGCFLHVPDLHHNVVVEYQIILSTIAHLQNYSIQFDIGAEPLEQCSML